MATSDPALTPQQAEHFRLRLEQEAARLRDLLTALERGVDSPGQGEASERAATLDEDAATELMVQEQYRSQARDVAHAMRAVEVAIERMAAGSYGRCSGCAQPIPLERLEVVPTAERCVACEQRRETTRRR